MTTHIPFEILTAIFEQFGDVADLRNLRTVSRTFCAVASPLAFRALSVLTPKKAPKILDDYLMSQRLRPMSGRSYCDPGAYQTQRKLI